ncbi:putative ABC transport system permease protein [Desulfitispora alkaliphila]|uniref:ABC transporter permease n=1 Tax=Desulfitispora alkaliphila TaxID=622674 RepID=UPI003D1F39AE
MFKKFGSLWVRLWFTAQMAGRGILGNPLRSALTILGVAIGVASVVALMGIGEGARQAVVSQFESLGSNVIVVEAKEQSVEFDADRAQDLVERVQGLDLATPVVHTEAVMQWRRDRMRADILGVNNHFSEIRDHQLIAGNFFTTLHVEQRSPVAVLGYNVALELMGGRSPVGQTFTMDGRTFRIVGVLEPKGESMGEGIDDKILIPYTTGQRIAEKRTVEEIWGKAGSPEEAELAVVQLGRIFSREMGTGRAVPRPSSGNNDGGQDGQMPGEPMPPPGQEPGGEPDDKDDDLALGRDDDLITVTSLNQLIQEADKANQVMTLLLGGIAAVSLLVGGLGIMNIMLVAVTERTKEIGVRRALGAKQTDLLIQFILEALYLSAIGAIAGIVAGIWGVNFFAQYGFETAISLQAIKVACGVALGAGLLFGVYPAVSASSVPPVEALRR